MKGQTFVKLYNIIHPKRKAHRFLCFFLLLVYSKMGLFRIYFR